MTRAPAIEELVLAEDPEALQRLGFRVQDGAMQVGSVRVRLEGIGGGITGWSVSGLAGVELDGLPLPSHSGSAERGGGIVGGGVPAAVNHPNGAIAIDHVVVLTPDLERTSGALEAAGVRLRRTRDGDSPAGAVRQGFFRMGEVILEVVQSQSGGAVAEPSGAPTFWGMVFTVTDIERCAELIGDGLGPIRDAVQPGRRIAPLRSSAGLGLAVALISPEL